MIDLKTELPISGHNFERHVQDALASSGYAERAMIRAADHLRREYAGKPDDYAKLWNLVDAEVLERTANRGQNAQPV